MKNYFEKFYEILCNFSYKIFQIKFDEEKFEKEKRVILISELNIPPTSNFSLLFLYLLILIPSLILLTFFIPFNVVLGLSTIFLFIGFFLYYYPYFKARSIRLRASAEMINFITYMAISLKQSRNLEKAVFLTYENLEGPLKKDLDKIIKRFYAGKVYDFSSELLKLADKWSFENREFAESLRMLVEYSKKPFRKELIDESVHHILTETYARMEDYSRKLKLPSMVLIAFGVFLPTITLTIFPIFSLFLPDILNFSFLFFVYNVILPFLLASFVFMIAQSRPTTTSPILEFKIFSIKETKFLIVLCLTFFLSYFILNNFTTLLQKYFACVKWQEAGFEEKIITNLSKEECISLISLPTTVFYSSLVVLIIPFPILFYILFSIKKWIKVREKVLKMEDELSECLFQLSNRAIVGTSLETIMEDSLTALKKFEIYNFIKRIVDNVRKLGFPLEKAIFDKKYGALNLYPSKLVRTVFKMIIESSRMGRVFLAQTMKIISLHLKKVKDLQRKIEKMISDHVSTLQFVASFVLPLVVGITVSLALIIIGIITSLSIKMKSLQAVSEIPMISFPFLDVLRKGVVKTSPGILIVTLGLYTLEISIISSILINALKNGYDRIMELNYIATITLISLTLFILSSLASFSLILPILTQLFEI